MKASGKTVFVTPSMLALPYFQVEENKQESV